jgi:hypothetical protein
VVAELRVARPLYARTAEPTQWEVEKVSENVVVRLLELDLEYLHRTIDKFDNQRFTIKSWTVTTGGALLALAVSTKNAGIPIVGLLVVGFFAYLEIVYMDMQVRVMDRCTIIGNRLSAALLDPSTLPENNYTLGVREAFGKEPFRWSSVPGILKTRPELYMFYSGLIVVMILCTLVLHFWRR